MRTRWLGWLVVAGAIAGTGCGGPAGTDAGDTAPGNDVRDVQVGNDVQMDDVQTPTDVQDVQAPMDVQDVQAPTDVQDVVGTDAQDVPTDTGPMPVPRTLQTNGSAVVLSADDRIAVAVNRTANSVSVFNVDATVTPPTATRVGTPLDVGINSEPWAAVLSQDGNTAYVILRRTQQVVRVDTLRGTPTLFATRATTGSEPTGVAISPSGARLYVANWADGTVTVVNTADMSVSGTIDLNPSLAGSGMLGTVASRAGLAHPRAIVITNSGDTNDADETAYVTEFFSQARTDTLPTDNSRFDVARQGVVYRFNLGTSTVAAPITIAPVTDTGFADTDGATTGCFPNQLSAAALNTGRLYVTALCESPRGPTGPGGTGNNFKTQIHTSIFVINTATNTEVPLQRVSLTQRFDALYGMGTLMASDPARRLPLIANDIAFLAGSQIAYVTSYGSDAVFRIRYNADGTFSEVGSSTNPFINLAPTGMTAGRLPVGIALTTAGGHGVVINEHSRNLSVLAFAGQNVAAVTESAPAPAAGTATDVNDGRRFFVTGLGRWSLNGQGWNSCETCHPDGLTDNVTWFFARGPRQTTSLDGTYSPDGMTRRILNWTAIFDEVHDFELNTRGNSGGVGAIVHRAADPATMAPGNLDRIIFDGTTPVPPQQPTLTPQAGLNGSTTALMPGGAISPNSVLDDWDDIDAYVRTIRAPRAPTNLVAADVTMGRTVFINNNCGGCHSGPSWTISRVFYTPNAANNSAPMNLLRATNYTAPAMFPAALNFPTSMGTRMAPLRFTSTDPMVVANNDQINCILRSVGTFPATPDAMMTGVLPAGSPIPVREVRANMSTLAQGTTGFNPPALVGMATGAPYFHAGNARTLEEAFDTTFRAHHQAFSANFLDIPATRDAELRQIIAFIQSIDDSTPTVTAMGSLAFNPDLCPATF